MTRAELLEALSEQCAECGHPLGLHITVTMGGIVVIEWCRAGPLACHCGNFVSASDRRERLWRRALDGPAVG